MAFLAHLGRVITCNGYTIKSPSPLETAIISYVPGGTAGPVTIYNSTAAASSQYKNEIASKFPDFSTRLSIAGCVECAGQNTGTVNFYINPQLTVASSWITLVKKVDNTWQIIVDKPIPEDSIIRDIDMEGKFGPLVGIPDNYMVDNEDFVLYANSTTVGEEDLLQCQEG